VGRYRDELAEAMQMVAEIPNSIFLGQAVAFPGTAMFGTLDGVPASKRIELPVEEDFQLGVSFGLAFSGYLPVSVFPRWNFLLLASNQLINHLDKAREMLAQAPPKVIIRTSIGSERPLHPGPQHTGDFTDAYSNLAENVNFVRLDEPEQVLPAYKHAAERTDGVSTVLVEWGDFYGEK